MAGFQSVREGKRERERQSKAYWLSKYSLPSRVLGCQGQRWVRGPAAGKCAPWVQEARSALCPPSVGAMWLWEVYKQEAYAWTPQHISGADVLHNCLNISPLWAHKTSQPITLLSFVLLSKSNSFQQVRIGFALCQPRLGAAVPSSQAAALQGGQGSPGARSWAPPAAFPLPWVGEGRSEHALLQAHFSRCLGLQQGWRRSSRQPRAVLRGAPAPLPAGRSSDRCGEQAAPSGAARLP